MKQLDCIEDDFISRGCCVSLCKNCRICDPMAGRAHERHGAEYALRVADRGGNPHVVNTTGKVFASEIIVRTAIRSNEQLRPSRQSEQ